MAADLQLQARALGDPTRHRLFRYIADAPAPVTVTELTGYAGLNHNAVRRHLAVLAGAGLVTEEAGRRDRAGRPRLLYRLHPEAAGEWGTPGAYAWLAGRQEGHRHAAEMPATGDPAGLPEQEMSRLGFRPARTDRGPRTADRVHARPLPVRRGARRPDLRTPHGQACPPGRLPPDRAQGGGREGNLRVREAWQGGAGSRKRGTP
jgi:DNA-binding transcriptional ArsR family regulator